MFGTAAASDIGVAVVGAHPGDEVPSGSICRFFRAARAIDRPPPYEPPTAPIWVGLDEAVLGELRRRGPGSRGPRSGCPSGGRSRRRTPRPAAVRESVGAAGLAEPARRHAHHGVAAAGEAAHAACGRAAGAEADLGAAVAVAPDDQGVGAVGAARVGREGDVDVERDAVEGLVGRAGGDPGSSSSRSPSAAPPIRPVESAVISATSVLASVAREGDDVGEAGRGRVRDRDVSRSDVRQVLQSRLDRRGGGVEGERSGGLGRRR